MRIKLAILDSDENYISRISSALITKYPDKVEVYSFTDFDAAISAIKYENINVLLAGQGFSIQPLMLPNQCGIAYLVDTMGINKVNGQPAICKFQKIDDIYRQILNIYSDHAEGFAISPNGSGKGTVVLFSSPCGGTGTSSVAAAFAIRMASKGKRAIYLNLEDFGAADIYFSGNGIAGMSDIIAALKGRRANIAMKLESCLKNDIRGVSFYSAPTNALDIGELSVDERLDLVSELRNMGLFDYIILDMGYSMGSPMTKVLRAVTKTVWVSDGSESANTKIERAYSSLKITEKQVGTSLSNKIHIVYNKFSNKVSKSVNNRDIIEIGGAPRYEYASTQTVLDKLSSLEALDKLS